MDRMNERPGSVEIQAGGSTNTSAASTKSSVAESSSSSNLTPASRTRLEWAQWMAEKNIRVFIARAGEKNPLKGRSWYTFSSTDPDEIAEMFAASLDCNYGLWLGEKYVVIDLDKKPEVNGITAFKELCDEHGELYEALKESTLAVETPSGGVHLYFKSPFGVSNANDFPNGIDTRGVQGYVIGPGCQIGENEYRLVDPDKEIAELPTWLHDYVRTPGQRDPKHDVPLVELDLAENVSHAHSWLQNRPPAIEGERGDDWTYETIQHLRDFGLSPTKILEVLNQGWNQKCEPPWSDGELEAKIENAWRYGQNRPGCKSPAYQAQRLAEASAAWSHMTDAQLSEYVGHRVGSLRLAVDNTASAVCEAPHAADDEVEDLFPAYLVGELDQIPDPVWLIRDVLPEMSLGMTYGETGSLKTFLELDKALWGAVGGPWAGDEDQDLEGFKVMRPLGTVIVAGEGARGLKRRIAAWAKRHGIKTDDLPVLVIPVMPRFPVEDDLKKLVRTIEAKLPDPDHVIVDTAMWAAAGLNLNVPADSQVLLSAFKRVMLDLGCSLTFVHHTGKDKNRGHLGAENLIAGVDVADCVDLEEKGTGYRRIKITNKKMKDAELREPVSMEAYLETVGTDEDGRKVGSLVLQRCQGAKVEVEADPRLALAQEIIAENKDIRALSMNALAEEMARRHATEELTEGELQKAKEGMRNYLKKAVTGELAVYAHKAGKAKNAQWVFRDWAGRENRAEN